jgi:hypothetical protein
MSIQLQDKFSWYLKFCRIFNFSGKEEEAGQLILDEEEEWLVANEWRHPDDHSVGHHSERGRSSLRAFLIDLNESFLDDITDE